MPDESEKDSNHSDAPENTSPSPASASPSQSTQKEDLETSSTQNPCPFEFLVAIAMETTCDENYSNYGKVRVTMDRGELIELSFAVLSTAHNRIVHQQQIFVRPEITALSPFTTQHTGITEDVLEIADTLKSAIEELDAFITANFITKNKTFCFVTLGEWNLRYQLFRETREKQIDLQPYYSSFYNIAKEVPRFLKFVESPRLDQLGQKVDITSLCTAVGISHQGRMHFAVDDASNIARIAQCVLDRTKQTLSRYAEVKSGIRIPFQEPINLANIMEEFDSTKSNVVQFGGLPFLTIRSDVETLVGLAGVRAAELWVGRNSDGRVDGTGYAVFNSHEDAKACLALYGQPIGDRTILVSPYLVETFQTVKQNLTLFPVSPEPLPTPPDMKPGDWICTDCNHHNYASRRNCMKCNSLSPRTTTRSDARPLPGSFSGMKPGDWICSRKSCEYQNFASRYECKRCGERRPKEMLSTSISSSKPLLPGDWNCSACGVHNFASRVRCVHCSTPSPSAGSHVETKSRPTDRPGDWNCAKDTCRYHNYASRMECYRCGTKRPQGAGVPPPPQITMKPGDWVCSTKSCGYHNFAKRDTCAACGRNATSSTNMLPSQMQTPAELAFMAQHPGYAAYAAATQAMGYDAATAYAAFQQAQYNYAAAFAHFGAQHGPPAPQSQHQAPPGQSGTQY